MTVTINGTSGITTPGVNSTASNTLGDAVGDTLNVGNGTIVTNSSGNVGIGTSSPSSILTVVGSQIIHRNTGSASNFVFGQFNSSGDASINNQANAPILFATNNTERMRIDSSGNLYIGKTITAAAGTTLWGNGTGNSWFNVTNNEAFTYNNITTGAGNFYDISFRTNNVSRGTIHVTDAATTYTTSSDYRLKENIQPMQNALGVVAQLNPVTYTWKADGSDGQGFIAHELQAVVPDCVTGAKDAEDDEGNPVYQGIDTSFLVATLTKAIQELSAKNDALEARLIAAEEQILALGVK